MGVVVLEGCAELLPALVAVAGANAAAAFEPHFAALARRVGPSRPEGQRSVAYATLVEMVKALGAAPSVARVAPRRAAGCVGEMAGAHTAGLRGTVRTAPASSLSSAAKRSPASARRSSRRSAGCWRAKAGTGCGRRRMPGRATTRRARRRARSSRQTAPWRATRGSGRRSWTLLAGVPLREDFEECASAYERGLAKLADLAAEVPAATERLGGVVAAAARVAGEAARNTFAGAPKDSDRENRPDARDARGRGGVRDETTRDGRRRGGRRGRGVA